MSPIPLASLVAFGPASGRLRLRAAADPAAIYAIGDVHGCHDLLVRLEAQIWADARDLPGEKWLIMLGDYIDRGPRSRQVLDHLIAPPPKGFTRLCLMGNHEQAMADFLRDPGAYQYWFDFGGLQTLASYGVGADSALGSPDQIGTVLEARIPLEHRAFLDTLPVLLETPMAIFVHAGLRTGVSLADQSEYDLLWIRDNYRDSYAEFGKTVVHGHTPRQTPLVTSWRIGIDTGAFASGRLSGVRLMAGQAPKLFEALGN